MAGVSSESLKAAQQDLEAKLPTAPLSLAEELFAILGLLDSNAGLRRSLTDPAREGQDKARLVSDLIGGKVSADARIVVEGLAASRWASARDIGDALETLAATTAIAVAESKGTGLDGLEGLENDLFSFIRAVNADHDLQRALSEPQASTEAKVQLALKLVPHAGPEAQVLISQAVSAPRGLKPTTLVQRFVELVAKRQRRWIAEVSVARPLTQDRLSRLQTGLDRLYGRELKINVNVDPSLVGGVRVQVGDEVVDSSVITRLAELRRKLAV
ncbi:ATP synthase F1 subunit delta [Arthrobacter crystallopoietes BAB-32]|uniref:ATP synthase subunit delta n=1 Tax=Arthrobacter crystallopoietes BAB-32 TaxID=1246476 RepID=N1V3Q8_9MICC|nr:F0F1 ATP synthase subunit delta [Arthrobacter crystallopoietes]EMY34654.1 ATP synthase F1 subunit delta [Arthrobacter crystallopoietes BAB-32]